MGRLWLTYAWKDNEDQNVDYIISQLKLAGIDVLYDKVHLIPGKRIWEQIDAGMIAPETTAWAILATEQSLASAPCREEIAYALDRALNARGGSFPLIGIFPAPLDRQLIPSAIATRLYVTLKESDWASKVAAGMAGRQQAPQHLAPKNFNYKVHRPGNRYVLEVWPRSGVWLPFFYAVSTAEANLIEKLTFAPNGILREAMIHFFGDFKSKVGVNEYIGKTLDQTIDPTTSAFIYCSTLPKQVVFGQPNTTDKVFDLLF